MFGKYLQVLRQPGGARFTAAGALARMQMSMAGIGAVMLISAERGSYAIAGAASAAYSISGAVAGPQISRFIDALGQRRIAPLQLSVHVPAIASLIAVALFTELTWPLFVLAGIAGATQPYIGPMVRARWSAMLSGTPSLRVAFAWESLVDEMVFILGPPLATVLALELFPSAALLVATLFLVVGTTLLLLQVGTEPKPSGRAHATGGRPAIMLPGVAAIAGIFVLIGGIFGAMEVTTVAFTKEVGSPGSAGLVLAIYSAGSLVGGLIFGAATLRASYVRQYVTAVLALAVVTLPLPFLGSVWALSIGALLAGVAVAPVLISGMALVERIVPSRRLTESMSWAGSGLSVGLAISMPAAGAIIDEVGASPAYCVMSGSAAGAAAIALLVLPTLRRAQATAVEEPATPVPASAGS